MTKPNDTKQKIKIADLMEKTEKDNTDKVVGGGNGIVSPRDAASGLPTGKRQHGPIKP